MEYFLLSLISTDEAGGKPGIFLLADRDVGDAGVDTKRSLKRDA
jgi:hypothetical protein